MERLCLEIAKSEWFVLVVLAEFQAILSYIKSLKPD